QLQRYRDQHVHRRDTSRGPESLVPHHPFEVVEADESRRGHDVVVREGEVQRRQHRRRGDQEQTDQPRRHEGVGDQLLRASSASTRRGGADGRGVRRPLPGAEGRRHASSSPLAARSMPWVISSIIEAAASGIVELPVVTSSRARVMTVRQVLEPGGASKRGARSISRSAVTTSSIAVSTGEANSAYSSATRGFTGAPIVRPTVFSISTLPVVKLKTSPASSAFSSLASA